jgi:hypothetical protein
LLAVIALAIPAAAFAATQHGGQGRPQSSGFGYRHDFRGFGTYHGKFAPVVHPPVSQTTEDYQLTAPLTTAPQCTLIVPANPLSAKGLATPYQLSSSGEQCSEADGTHSAFVQATILNTETGQLSIYDPEVIDAGTTPTVKAPVPQLGSHDVLNIWVGYNDTVLKLVGPGAGSFINFAQQSYANDDAFYSALNSDIENGTVTVPNPGVSTADGMTCPTTHDFSIVDQDPSDNVPVTYAYNPGISNGSDEQLLDAVLASIGCGEWTVPTLDPTVSGAGPLPSGALQEVQATLWQAAPVADIPGLDEFVTNNGQFTPAGVPDLALDNLYRAQVDEPFTLNDNDTAAWCTELAQNGAPRLAADAKTENESPAPSFAQIGNSLALVLANRFIATWVNLGCTGTDPISTDNSSVATTATYVIGGVTTTVSQATALPAG